MDLHDQMAELERSPRRLSAPDARDVSRVVEPLRTPPHVGSRQAQSWEVLAGLAAHERERAGPESAELLLHKRLMRAIVEGDPEGCSAALEAGARVNGIPGAGPAPLTLAVRCASRTDDNRCVEILLRQPGVKVDVVGRSGETPLHEAAATGNTKAVRLLLGAGANPLLQDNMGRTPRKLLAHCQIAGRDRFPELVSLLEDAESRRGRPPKEADAGVDVWSPRRGGAPW